MVIRAKEYDIRIHNTGQWKNIDTPVMGGTDSEKLGSRCGWHCCTTIRERERLCGCITAGIRECHAMECGALGET
jgi:hypothetical protein